MNIGIVGLGHLGKVHTRLLNENKKFNITSIFDIDEELTQTISAQYNINAAATFDELLTQCQAISIVTPTPTHFELASRAIKKGLHVFIEKPATNDIEDTKKLITMAREAGVVVQVGHVERFNPAFLSTKEYIQNPLFFEIHRLACYNSRGTDVSVVLDLMIHDIDLVLSCVKSNIKHISATGTAIVSKTVDMANARIEFENGCVANLTCNRVALNNIRKMRIFQPNAYILIDLLAKTSTISKIEALKQHTAAKGILIDTGEGNEHHEITQLLPTIQPINAIAAELDCFYESIINKAPVAVSLIEAEAALLVAQEIENQIKK